MVNKRSLWFLTLFSLILVLSVYYITMPSELLLTNSGNYQEECSGNDCKKECVGDECKEKDSSTSTIKESDLLVALRVEADEEVEKEMESLKKILTDTESSVDEKNNAFEKMKGLNVTKGEEEELEKKIEEKFQLKSFVKIDGDQIRVVVAKESLTKEEANEIMRFIQSNYSKKMYISVKFQK